MSIEPGLLDEKQVGDLKVAFGADFAEFLKVYFKDFEGRQQELIVAVNAQQLDKIALIAHAMKGSSLNVGANALGLVCSDIEAAGRINNYDQVMIAFNKLDNLYEQTKLKMNQMSS